MMTDKHLLLLTIGLLLVLTTTWNDLPFPTVHLLRVLVVELHMAEMQIPCFALSIADCSLMFATSIMPRTWHMLH